jgi:flagellar protein FliO/FliZ
MPNIRRHISSADAFSCNVTRVTRLLRLQIKQVEPLSRDGSRLACVLLLEIKRIVRGEQRALNRPYQRATAGLAWRTTAALMFALGASHLAAAAENTPFAAVTAQGAPGAVGGTLRVTVAMIVVLCAVLVTAWFARRLRGASGAGASGLEVLGQVPLGTRERAVLIRVGERQLLIGVAPGNVRTLHVIDAPASGAAPVAIGAAAPGADNFSRPTFKSLLLKSLGK